MRTEVREQLGDRVDSEFDAHFPPWDQLPLDTQESKILIARDELLRVLDRAGYQVRRKKSRAETPLA